MPQFTQIQDHSNHFKTFRISVIANVLHGSMFEFVGWKPTVKILYENSWEGGGGSSQDFCPGRQHIRGAKMSLE
jgi:hypothetical protein